MIQPKDKAKEFVDKFGKDAYSQFLSMMDLFKEVGYNAIPEYWNEVKKELEKL